MQTYFISTVIACFEELSLFQSHSYAKASLCRRGAGEREARWARWEEGLEKRGMCQYGGCGSVEFCYPLLNLTTKSPLSWNPRCCL